MKTVVMLSSEEQFDLGLLHSLCYLSKKILLLKILSQDSCTFKVKTDLVIKEHNECKIISIETYNVIALKKILSKMEKKSDIIIIPRNAPLKIHLWIFTRKIVKILKLESLILKNRHKAMYILWYSPSPAFIFKFPYYLFLEQSLLKKSTLIYKAIMSILFNLLIPLVYDKVLVKDPPTYTFLRRFARNVLFLLPYLPRVINKEDCPPDSITRESILSVITIKRKGIASRYEERYLRLLSIIARMAREFKFVVIGTSRDEAEAILKKGLDNVIFLGKIYGVEYYNILTCCKAVFAYIEIPGTSNRIAEAIAYGKPVITSELALSYHIGLKDHKTAVVLRLNKNSIKDFIAILKDGNALLEITRRLELLHKLYYQYNINQLRLIAATKTGVLLQP